MFNPKENLKINKTPDRNPKFEKVRPPTPTCKDNDDVKPKKVELQYSVLNTLFRSQRSTKGRKIIKTQIKSEKLEHFKHSETTAQRLTFQPS